METTIPELTTPNKPDMLNGQSLNISEEKRRQLKTIFPEVFTEGEIDFNRLKAVLGELTADGKEHYTLTWAGKYDAFREIQKQTTATLIPDREKSIDFDATGNIFIEGENLEALRVLQKSYYGKVKMIYIDPPYNTGNDSFIYPDDFAERLDEYRKRAGITDEEGFLNKQDLWKKNTKENGQFHSVWLSMMYPRLYLARNLLRDDGVIFVSIDDNEVANLRLLMDEVFGEENFIGTFVRRRRLSTGMRENPVSPDHEYVVAFARSHEQVELFGRARSEADYPYEDKEGKYRSTDLTVGMTREMRPNQYYPIRNPKTGIEYYPPDNRIWRFQESTMNEEINADSIIWPDDFPERTMARPRYKTRFISAGMNQRNVPVSTWIDSRMANRADSLEVGILNIIGGLNQEATKEVRELFGTQLLEYPKPVSLLRSLIDLGSTDDDLILDFFAGSGSTAHAVLDLNREDGGNRKFICVQLPEPTDEKSEARKAGYDTIADISRARIRKVIEKMNEENAGKLDLETPGDLGFRSYTLAPSNFKLWRGTLDNAELSSLLLEFQDAHKEGADAENMLTELLLKAGFPLTAPVERLTVGGGTVWNVDNGRMVVLLERIDDAIRDYLLETKPGHVVCLDTVFENNDQLLTNLSLQLREAGVELTVV